MDSHFKLLTGIFINEARPIDRVLMDFGRQKDRSIGPSSISFDGFDDLLCRLVDNFIIVSFELNADALCCLGFFRYFVWHNRSNRSYASTLVTTPAPTVLPPSRIAKRCFSCMAIGAINLTLNVTVSPGMTISVPSGNVTSPVTSVVLK